LFPFAQIEKRKSVFSQLSKRD